MNKYLEHLRSGDKIKVFFTDQPPKTFTIFCIADDEIMLTEPQKVYAAHRNFPGNEIIINHTVKLNGTPYSMGDKLVVTSESGYSYPMYISYWIDKSNFTLSHKKIPSGNSLKWVLRMMQNSV